MRPQLTPALHRLWRDGSTLQLGLAPGRCAVITDADHDVIALLDQLDGTRTLDDITAEAASESTDGLTLAMTETLLRQLSQNGLLVDASTSTEALHRLPSIERTRLRDDMGAWSTATTGIDGAHGVLARRRRAWIDIRANGRLGFACARLLATAGIGRLTIADPTLVEAQALAPLGPTRDHLGQRTSQAVYDDLSAHAPATRRTPRMSSGPDVTLIIETEPLINLDVIDDLMRRDAVHLPVVQRGGGFVLGPLVLPGRSACVRCVDHMRTEQDPAWPWMTAQLRTDPRAARAAVAAHDSVLGTAAAALLCLQVLTYIDGETAPLLVDAIGHLALPHGQLERVPAAAHPACGCTWPGQVVAPRARQRRAPRTMAM